MLIFLIIIFIFIAVCVWDKIARDKKAAEYLKNTKTNCRLEYEIGCGIFREMIETYNTYAIQNVNHFDNYRNGAEKTLYECGAALCGGHSIMLPSELFEFYKFAQENHIIDRLVLLNRSNLEEWMNNDNYKDRFFIKLKSGKSLQLIYTETLNDYLSMFKKSYEEVTTYARSYCSPSTLQLVAKHYNLPTKKDTHNTNYSGFGDYKNLAQLIGYYAMREIKNRGFESGCSYECWYYLTEMPTEDGYYRAEQCESIGSKSKNQKEENFNKKFPWFNKKQ